MKPKSHDEFRASVCVGCHKSGVKQVVTSAKVQLIQEKVYNGFSKENTAVPYGLCESCRGCLNRGTFVKKFDYDELIKSIKRNSNSLKCVCYICEKGRSKKRNVVKKLKPGPKPFIANEEIDQVSKPLKICRKCNQVIGRGIRHACLKRLQAGNLLHLAKRGNTRQQMASKVIREVGNGNSTVQLKNTQGKPLEVSITSHKIRKNSARPQVSFNQLRKLRSQGKFSDTTVDKVVTPFIREGLIKCRNVRRGRGTYNIFTLSIFGSINSFIIFTFFLYILAPMKQKPKNNFQFL